MRINVFDSNEVTMGWRSGAGDESGSGLPEDAADPPTLPDFANGSAWDTCHPSAALAAALECASGPQWRAPGATRDEMLGLLRQWQALESWAAAGKLGLLRALIRDDDQPLPGGSYTGDLPQGWTKSLTHEVALALSMPAVSAEKLMWLAWNLQAMLPGINNLLAAGELTLPKARAVDQALNLLTDQDAARAEAMILPELPGKTYGQVEKLAVQAALTVDPDAAERRRQDAEQRKSRVQMFREQSGAAALSGRDLPTDQTLTAHASVCTRAQEYQDSGVFPDDTRMDQYRVAAYLDLLNGISAGERIAVGQVATVAASVTPASVSAAGSGADTGESEPGDGPGDGGPETERAGAASLATPRLADVVVPLATLLGLARRPGESHGLGVLDPGLCHELAAAAIHSRWTKLCVTVTTPDGIAIGHGCARPASGSTSDRRHPATDPALPARLNLTIPAARLTDLADLATRNSPPGQPPWAFTRDTSLGPPGGYGTWTLTLPTGRRLTVRLGQLPTLDCDHRHESHAYQPNDTLRHLVQVRDYECTFPPCTRHARESDFEHAVPYHQGGKTCACNAGARSRQCHQIKQSPGWTVTQPQPGWHQWTTPSGRSYTQSPKHYPA